MNNEIAMICDLILYKHLDILALTGAWLTGDPRDNTVIADLKLTLPTHDLFQVPRRNRNGGGVGIHTETNRCKLTLYRE